MRLFGNAIQQFYGTLTITPPAGLVGLTIASGGASITGGLLVNDSSGSVWGSPTGGPQGAGTINVAGGLFVNGVAVGGSGTTILKAVSTATQTTTANTTLGNDTSLTLALTTGKYYAIYMNVGFVDAAGAAGGGYKVALNYTGTGGSLGVGGVALVSTGSLAVAGEGNVTSSFAANTTITGSAFASLAIGATAVYMGTVFAGSVGGNLVVQFAQANSNASTLTRQAGSSLTAIQLN